MKTMDWRHLPLSSLPVRAMVKCTTKDTTKEIVPDYVASQRKVTGYPSGREKENKKAAISDGLFAVPKGYHFP